MEGKYVNYARMGKLVNTVAAQPKAVKNLSASTTIPKGVEYVKWTIILRSTVA